VSGTVSREVAKLFGLMVFLVFACALTVFLVGDFADRLNAFLDKDWIDVASLYLHKLLGAVVQLAPAVLLLSAGMTCSVIRKRGEWVALQSLGFSARTVFAPILAFGSVLAVMLMMFDDQIATKAGAEVDRLMVQKFGRWGDARLYYSPQQWFRIKDAIFYVRGRQGELLQEVTILKMSEKFEVLERMDVGRMESLQNDLWKLTDITRRRFETQVHESNLTEQVLFLRQTEAQEAFTGTNPQSFEVVAGRPELMPTKALLQQIEVRRKVGLGGTRLHFALHNRLAYQLLGVAGAWLACLLALRGRRKGHLTVSLIEGTGIIGGLFVLSLVGRSLAFSERIPPALGAWGPVLVLLVLTLLVQRKLTRAAS
jgi:lipopolysaccharide export system permease protein